MTKHSRTTRIRDSASGEIGLDAPSEIRKALKRRGGVLVYRFEIRIKAEEGDQIEIAEEMDLLDAISGAVYALPEYENSACITTKITGDPKWQKTTSK